MPFLPTAPLQWIEAQSGLILNAGCIERIQCNMGMNQPDSTATVRATLASGDWEPLTEAMPSAEAQAVFTVAKRRLMRGRSVSVPGILAERAAENSPVLRLNFDPSLINIELSDAFESGSPFPVAAEAILIAFADALVNIDTDKIDGLRAYARTRPDADMLLAQMDGQEQARQERGRLDAFRQEEGK